LAFGLGVGWRGVHGRHFNRYQVNDES
jgi:hypothetical protein